MTKVEDDFKEYLKNLHAYEVISKWDVKRLGIQKTKTSMYFAKDKNGHAACAFEVMKRKSRGEDPDIHHDFFLAKLKSFALNIPTYAVIYDKATDAIYNFSVRKLTPKSRYVGEMSPRQFAKFVIGTVKHSKKELEKETPNGNCRL